MERGLNLPAIAAETLEAKGGFFGWVLRLIQQRKSRPREFQRLLNRVVQHGHGSIHGRLASRARCES